MQVQLRIRLHLSERRLLTSLQSRLRNQVLGAMHIAVIRTQIHNTLLGCVKTWSQARSMRNTILSWKMDVTNQRLLGRALVCWQRQVLSSAWGAWKAYVAFSAARWCAPSSKLVIGSDGAVHVVAFTQVALQAYAVHGSHVCRGSRHQPCLQQMASPNQRWTSMPRPSGTTSSQTRQLYFFNVQCNCFSSTGNTG